MCESGGVYGGGGENIVHPKVSYHYYSTHLIIVVSLCSTLFPSATYDKKEMQMQAVRMNGPKYAKAVVTTS